MNHRILSKLAAVLTMVIWGFAFMFSKVAMQYADTSVVLAVRFTVAFLLMQIIKTAAGIRFDLKEKPVGQLLLLGLLEPIIYFLCENNGIRLTSASFSGVMIALVPIATLIGSAVFLKERPTVLQVLFSILSVAGVVIMSISPGGESLVTPAGVVLMIGAVIAASAFALVSRRIADAFSPFERTWFMFMEGFVFFAALALVTHMKTPGDLIRPLAHLPFVASVLFLGTLSSVLAFFCQNYYLTWLSVPEAAVFANLCTVFSVIAGVVFLHEPFTARTIPCVLLIIVGVIGVQLAGRHHST